MEGLQRITIEFLFVLVRYFIFAGIAFYLVYHFYKATLRRKKIQLKEAKAKDFKREIYNSVISIMVFTLVIPICDQFLFKGMSQVYYEIDKYPVIWIPLSVLLALIIQDTYFYWLHRAMHLSKMYKKVHYVHHQSINPSPWASYSFQYTEAVLEAIIIPIILVIMPMNFIALIIFTSLSLFINVYGHLGYEIMPKWVRNSFIFEIVSSSVHHNIHHEKFHYNYCLYFRFWDRVMGTEHPEYVKIFDEVINREHIPLAEANEKPVLETL